MGSASHDFVRRHNSNLMASIALGSIFAIVDGMVFALLAFVTIAEPYVSRLIGLLCLFRTCSYAFAGADFFLSYVMPEFRRFSMSPLATGSYLLWAFSYVPYLSEVFRQRVGT